MQKHNERYKLKRLATHYFLHDRVLFKKGYDRDPLRCLGYEEASDRLLLAHHEEGHNRICEEMSQLQSTSQPDSHSPTELTQHDHPMALPHLGA